MNARKKKPISPMRVKIGFVIFVALATALVSALAKPPPPHAQATRASLAALPPTMLWAWERPERLDRIDADRTGIAFLVRTLYLRGDEVIVRPRLQLLDIPQRAALMAVVRIESDPRENPTLSRIQTERSVVAIAEMARLDDVRAVQIDFDAVRSERDFYRDLLGSLRQTLGRTTPISITALASWCIHDEWLDRLPIDEAVPMLFRMGVGHREVVNHLKTHMRFRAAACQDSIGISTDEPLPRLPPHQRTYVFNPKSWTPETVRGAMKESTR